MRIRPSLILGLLGMTAGLAATAALASGHHAGVHATACGCRPVVRRHRVHARWTHVRHTVIRQTAFVARDERDWSDSHSWRSAREVSWGWSERPWATDQFGFLTWPGKSHFVDGHMMRGAVPPPPPPPPEDEMQGPPPGDDWEGPPPPPGAEESYQTYRF
jgi:hypothetical protein